MIRNLKILIAAVMALAAFGALSAAAYAAEEVFHCSVEPCRATLAPDETAGTTTAHQVFVVKGKTAGGAEVSASLTCNQLAGEATPFVKTPTEITFTNLRYLNSAGEQKCKVGASETMEVNFTSCDFRVTSKGGAISMAELHVVCSTVGDAIDIIIKGTTCIKITPFTATGLGYHDSEIGGKKKIATGTTNVSVPVAAADLQNIGHANCAALGLASITSLAFTTGNTLVKAETGAGVPAETWFE